VQKVSDCVPQTATEVCSATSIPSPAKNAGVLAGDKLVKINNQSFKQWSDAVEVIRANAGKTLSIVVDRNGNLIPITVTPADSNGGWQSGWCAWCYK
jgi:predicted metalloprotease with PDZ domain